jgi:predicted Zn-dependent protease with MMP-like domain
LIDEKDWEKSCAVAAAEIEMTLAELPTSLRKRAEKLPVIFELIPNVGLQADGIEADTLGLFTGAEMMEEGEVVMPSRLILFLESIQDVAGNDENAFREEIGVTFLHELVHFFGLDEADLVARS